MKKALGLALGLTLALALSAAAEEAKGTIYSINPADHSIVLDDGTKLWVSEGEFADLSLGSEVQAAYEARGDRKTVIQLSRPGLEGIFDRLNSVQADGE
jgi:hypothetical protein